MNSSLIESLESRRLLSNFYLSPGGNDLNNGSQGAPFKTIAKLNTLDLNPGDGVYFQGGATFAGTFKLTDEDLGSASQPIVVSSYGTGRATINGGDDDGIFAKNTSGISISNLAFIGSGLNPLNNDPSGINFWMDLTGNVKKDYIRIDNVEASGFWEAGIRLEQRNGINSSSGFNDVQITNSVVHDIGNQGIVFYGGAFNANSNVLVRNCTTFNIRGNAGLDHNSGNGIVLGSVQNGTVEFCKAYHNGTAGWGGVGIWAWNADNITIQFCESYDNHTTNGADGGGFDLDGGVTNSRLQYNYSHDNEGSGYGLFQFRGIRNWSNNVVRYNISANDARGNNAAGISLWCSGSGITNAEIYNNSIYLDNTNLEAGATPQALIFASSRTSNVHLRNNIFMTRNGIELVDIARNQSGIIMQGNDYWSDGAAFKIKWANKTYASVSAFQTGTGLEKLNSVGVGLNVNPQFVSPGATTIGNATAYRLQNTSPLINAGVNLIALGLSPGTRDYFGNALPTNTSQRFDVGAHEFVV